MLDPAQIKRNKLIVNIFAGIGIVGGIIARRMSGLEGMIPGAIYGACGALIGGSIGGLIVYWLLPKTEAPSDEDDE